MHINGITNKKVPFDDPLSVNQDSWIISDSFCLRKIVFGRRYLILRSVGGICSKNIPQRRFSFNFF